MLDASQNALYQTLLDLKVVDKTQLDLAKKTAEETSATLTEELLRRELISDENLGRVQAEVFGKPLIRLVGTAIDMAALHVLPEVVARHQQALVFAKDQTGLKLAMVHPDKADFAQHLAKKTGDVINVFYATARDLDQALDLYKSDLLARIKGAPTVADMLDLILAYAHTNRASDIHIESQEEGNVIRFRIDGLLHDILTIPKPQLEQVVTRVKVMAQLRTDEHASAQDGKMAINLSGDRVDIRVSIVPVVGGEKVVLRLLSARARQFSLNDLGMAEKDKQKMLDAISQPHGMVLSTGPTGSGKTTTIYALLKILNTRDRNIATIEDPVEYDIEGINQIQVNLATNLTFADGLRAILRQDPNIIFVGEIRDAETAGIAINSALTGHLVLSTVHTNDAATTLPRLLDMGVEPFLVASTINAIVAQRLVRQICGKCRVSYEAEVENLGLNQQLIKEILKSKKKVRIYKGKGCAVCHMTGFLGRVGVFEVLKMTESLRKLIMARADADALVSAAVKEGMVTMMADGLQKVWAGQTTIEEVVRLVKYAG